MDQTRDAYHRFVQLQGLGKKLSKQQTKRAAERRTKQKNDARQAPKVTPPLAVPIDSLDQIRLEHMTLSSELPDFEGD